MGAEGWAGFCTKQNPATFGGREGAFRGELIASPEWYKRGVVNYGS